MQVFVDESGDTGFKFEAGSSRNFTVTAVIFPDAEAAENCRTRVRELRSKLGFHPNFEFKFNRAKHPIRTEFLTAISEQQFRFYSFALDKPRLFAGALKQKDRMYSKVVSWVFENAMPTLKNATVTFDRTGEREFYQLLERYLDASMRNTGHVGAISQIRAAESHTDDLLQVADMVCGAIARSYSGKPNGSEYRKVIARNQGQTRWWP